MLYTKILHRRSCTRNAVQKMLYRKCCTEDSVQNMLYGKHCIKMRYKRSCTEDVVQEMLCIKGYRQCCTEDCVQKMLSGKCSTDTMLYKNSSTENCYSFCALPASFTFRFPPRSTSLFTQSSCKAPCSDDPYT